MEDALEQNITRFWLELGSGFAFIGRQKEIIVAGKTRKIDMLFYHIKLRCYVVVELKAISFEPEFAGKHNFYVNAVNELMKSEADNPTIGLLICKDKDQTEVQWAFQGIETPMGVATYDNIRLQEIERTLKNIIPFIEGKLFLKVNRDKTSIAHISKVKYLGYSFYRYKGKCRFRVHPKSIEKMKNKIRELTNRSNGWGNEYRALKLTQYIRGWVNYFGMADMKSLLRTT